MDLVKLQELAQGLPETVRQNAIDLVERMGETIEGIGDKPVTWRPSTLKLVQAMSDRAKLPKGANVGDFLLGENVVPQPLEVIVLRSWNARQYWSPDQNEAKMLCSSPDAKLGYIGLNCNACPHALFNEETKKTECNKIKVVMVVKRDLSDVFLVQFAKTSYKAGGEWEGLMKKAGVSTYRRVYGIKSEDSKAYKNVMQMGVETFAGDNRDTPVEFLPFVVELFNQVGDDRKASLTEFYKVIQGRASNPALLANSSGADSEVLLLNSDSADVTGSSNNSPFVADASAAPAKSSSAKKYVV